MQAMWEAETKAARDERRLLRVVYRPPNGKSPSERMIEVPAIHPPSPGSVSHLRRDIRSFRPDRLVEVEVLDKHFGWDPRLRMIAIHAIKAFVPDFDPD